MRLRFNLLTIPVTLGALGLWAVIGGWYVAVATPDVSGTDNIGIVLSIFGACLFIADRVAHRWFRSDCWLIFLKLWTWGLLFVAWGLVEWLRAFQAGYWLSFALHWTGLVLVLAVSWLLGRRRGDDASPGRLREASGTISLRRK